MSTRPTVYLRAVEPSDAEALHRWYGDPEFRAISGSRYPSSSQRWTEWTSRHKEPSFHDAVFAVTTASGDNAAEIIGIGKLAHTSAEDRSAEIGVLIGESENRSRGYGTAATAELLRFGFDVMGLHRIYCRMLTRNTAGMGLIRTLGAVHEGTARQARWSDGRFHDVAQYALLADEFVRESLHNHDGHHVLDQENSTAPKLANR